MIFSRWLALKNAKPKQRAAMTSASSGLAPAPGL